MSATTVRGSVERPDEKATASNPDAGAEHLDLFETLAIQSVENISRLAREGNNDPERIALALDRIDFALGQAIRTLHRE